MSQAMQVRSFFDSDTATGTHVIHTGQGSECAVVDSVLDFDQKSGRTRTQSADQVIEFIRQNQLRLTWILETHAHADHLSAAPYIKQHLGGKIAIARAICQVQSVFQRIFNLEPEFAADGSQFDHLFDPDEAFSIGGLKVCVMQVPGHTPACAAYQISDDSGQLVVFVGDTLFMPDVGTARCDFPGGDAKTLYRSIQTVLALPPKTRLYLCHDYPPTDASGTTRAVSLSTTVADQRAHNIHVRDGISEAEFIAMRTARDATLSMPQLILPSIQVNIRAGSFPPAEGNGVHYLKLPLNLLG